MTAPMVLPVLPFDWTDESGGHCLEHAWPTHLNRDGFHFVFWRRVEWGPHDPPSCPLERPTGITFIYTFLGSSPLALENAELVKWKEKPLCPDSESGTTARPARPNNCSHFHSAGRLSRNRTIFRSFEWFWIWQFKTLAVVWNLSTNTFHIAYLPHLIPIQISCKCHNQMLKQCFWGPASYNDTKSIQSIINFVGS